MPAECLAYPARLFSHLDLTLGRGSQGSKIDYHPSKTERSLQAVVCGMPAWTQTDNKHTAPVAWVVNDDELVSTSTCSPVFRTNVACTLFAQAIAGLLLSAQRPRYHRSVLQVAIECNCHKAQVFIVV